MSFGFGFFENHSRGVWLHGTFAFFLGEHALNSIFST